MVKVVQAVFLLLEQPYNNWDRNMRDLFDNSWGRDRYLQRMINHDFLGYIMEPNIDLAKRYMKRENLGVDPESLMERSVVTGTFYNWVQSVLRYEEINRIVVPKKQKLKELQSILEAMSKQKSFTNSVVKQLKFQPYVLAALASLESDRDLSELPEWVQNIINKMNRPLAINFDADHAKVPLMIEADYNFPISSHD